MEPEGEVWLAIDFPWESDDNEVSWSGYWADQSHHLLEHSPLFTDAVDAVEWGRTRSAVVYIRLADDGYLWAGDGPPPREDMDVFDPEDPRARQSGGQAMALELRQRAAVSREMADQEARRLFGARLRREREASGLPLDAVASRLGRPVTAEQLADVESGLDELAPSLVFEWAWTLRDPWPHPGRQTRADQLPPFGWVAVGESLIDLALILVKVRLGEADPEALDRWRQ